MNLFRNLLAALALTSVSALALAQSSWPDKPLRLIVPAAPGGASDLLARILAEKLGQALGQQVIVDNRAGASGAIGAMAVARAAPDGYTLLLGGQGANVLNMVMFPEQGLTTRDFAPISLVASGPLLLLVAPSAPFKSLTELVAAAKAAPGKYSFASIGLGSAGHMTGEALMARAGIKLLHVPYKAGGQIFTDTMSGQVTMMFGIGVRNYIDDGRLKALGATSLRRSSIAPDVPSFAESGLRDFEIDTWFGIFAPAKTPASIVRRLADELAKIAAPAEMAQRLVNLGMVPRASTPEQFDAMLAKEMSMWTEITKNISVK